MAGASIIHRPEAMGGGTPWSGVGIYYVRIAADRLVVRSIASRREHEDVPLAALDGGGAGVALGRAAELAAGNAGAGITLRRPFARLETAADVDLAAHLLRAVLRRTRRVPRWPLLIRGMIVQPDDVGDGLAEPEREQLVAVARRAGAFSASVWTDRPLSDREVVAAFGPPLLGLGW